VFAMKSCRQWKPFVFGAMVVLSSFSLANAENWTSFQGTSELGSRAQSLEKPFGAGWRVLYRTPTPGYGQSSPVVYDGNVYLTSIEGPQKEKGRIIALDLATGQQKWEHLFDTASGVTNSNIVSRAAPTPAVDRAGVIALFESGDVIALDHAGKVRWTRNLITEYGPIKTNHGIAASVEQQDDRVFVWVERSEDPYVLALNKTDGTNIWKSPGVGATSWASPHLVEVAKDEYHLVLSGSGKLMGLDPATGEQRWMTDNVKGNTSPTPFPLGNGQILVGATGGRGESSGGGASGKPSDFNGVVQISKDESGAWSAAYSWRSTRSTSSFGSPIVHGDCAYFVSARGDAFCHDAKTGKEHWMKSIGETIWATPIGCGDGVIFVGKGGHVTIIAAGDKFEKLAEYDLFPKKESPAEAPATGEKAAGEKSAATDKPAGEKSASGNSASGEKTAPPQGGPGRGPPYDDPGPVAYAVVRVGDLLLVREGDALTCISVAAQ
jgi:outer membrane protein assembly factor BamB